MKNLKLSQPQICSTDGISRVHLIYVIKGEGVLVNPSEKHQYRNKGDKPFKMICGVPKEFE